MSGISRWWPSSSAAHNIDMSPVPLLLVLVAGGVLVSAAPTDKGKDMPSQQPEDGRSLFSLVSLPSLLPSLLSGPEFNLFNINKPPIVFGGQSSAPSGGFLGLPPSVWVVNSAGTSSGSPSASAASS